MDEIDSNKGLARRNAHPLRQCLRRDVCKGRSPILVNFRRLQGVSSPWVMIHVRANQEEVTKEVQVAGFEPASGRDRFGCALPNR